MSKEILPVFERATSYSIDGIIGKIITPPEFIAAHAAFTQSKYYRKNDLCHAYVLARF